MNVNRIPNIMHFCFGFDDKIAYNSFGLLEYLAIKSAFDCNEPDEIIFHCGHLPRGPWWERIKPLVTLREVVPPKAIFDRPLHHYAHKADVVRLDALIREGGVYMDLDTLCLRSFDPLRENSFVMGIQARRGLCNAVMLGEPNSEFARAWRKTYRSFDASQWDYHSVVMPWKLARSDELESQITVLPSNRFFWPHWRHFAQVLFGTDDYDFQNSFCIHYWSQMNREYLDRIDLDWIRDNNCNFSRLVQRHLTEFL